MYEYFLDVLLSYVTLLFSKMTKNISKKKNYTKKNILKISLF